MNSRGRSRRSANSRPRRPGWDPRKALIPSASASRWARSGSGRKATARGAIRAIAVRPAPPVEVERGLAEQLREPSLRRAPLKLELKEPVARRQVSLDAESVGHRARRDGGDAPVVERDTNRLPESRDRRGGVVGEVPPDQPDRPPGRDEDDEQRRFRRPAHAASGRPLSHSGGYFSGRRAPLGRKRSIQSSSTSGIFPSESWTRYRILTPQDETFQTHAGSPPPGDSGP